jgi:hypothetical protein
MSLRLLSRFHVPYSQFSLLSRFHVPYLQFSLLQNNTFEEDFWLIFLFNICHCNSGLTFKSKNYPNTSQNCMYFLRENSQNLHQMNEAPGLHLSGQEQVFFFNVSSIQEFDIQILTAHSFLLCWCLIHNAHLGKILSFS